MEFKELTDEQWEHIKGFIPPPARTGRPRIDDRKVINGILWALITGSRWQDRPKRYCHPTTAWRRLKEFEEKGVWEKVLQGLL